MAATIGGHLKDLRSLVYIVSTMNNQSGPERLGLWLLPLTVGPGGADSWRKLHRELLADSFEAVAHNWQQLIDQGNSTSLSKSARRLLALFSSIPPKCFVACVGWQRTSEVSGFGRWHNSLPIRGKSRVLSCLPLCLGQLAVQLRMKLKLTLVQGYLRKLPLKCSADLTGTRDA